MAAAEKKKKSVGRKFLYNLLGLGVLIVGITVAVHWGLRSYTRHGDEIDVPELKGLSVDKAVQRIRDAGLRATLSDSVYVKELPANTIYSQSVTAGTHVKAGRIVHLTVNSSHPPMVLLPDLADNCSVREARMKLTVLGIKNVTVESIDGELDWVYGLKVNGKNAAAYDRIPSESKVTLVVGNGSFSDDEEETVGIMADESVVTGVDDDYGVEVTAESEGNRHQ